MPEGAIFLAVVILQRLGELALARSNTKRLLANGAREHGAAHYPLIVALHASWLAVLVALGWDAPVNPWWLAAYVVLQALRVWILASLGRRWTTRIIVTPEPPLRRGPYRYVDHPNYLLVAAEFVVVPMVLGLPVVALAFSAANAIVLWIRISAENAALGRDRTGAIVPKG